MILIRNYDLSAEGARKMKGDIAVPLDDGIQFAVKGVESIMDEAEYLGIRFKLEVVLDTMKTPLKMDISTDDVMIDREFLEVGRAKKQMQVLLEMLKESV